MQEISKRLKRFKTLITGPWPALLLVALVAFAQARATETPASSQLQVLISVPDQKLAVVKDGQLVARFPVSTSRFGTGDQLSSYKTPLGQLRVYDKIGDGLTPGAVIRHRAPTGEVLPVNAPGRDPIVTRVIWLDGLEPQNKNALSRCIYIHGTPEEKTIGTPVSWGCIRMRSKDVIKVFDSVPVGTVVSIIPEKLPHLHHYQAPKNNPLQPAPTTLIASNKPPQQPKSTPPAAPSVALSKPAPLPANPTSGTAKASESAPAPSLPAIAEAPQQSTPPAWHAMKGSFLLANLPSFFKPDDHAHKTAQETP